MTRTYVTNITPLPAGVSREIAVAVLHDHQAMIQLNPLVTRYAAGAAPKAGLCTPEEAEKMAWYDITDEINYLPGTRLAKGEVTYKGGFYNLPRGLQTHVFAPAGVGINAKWSVEGSMPGEERRPLELGVDAPRDGLYLREDVLLRCNMILTGFVKKNLHKSHRVLCDNLKQRAASAIARRSAGPSAHLIVGESSHLDSSSPSWDQSQHTGDWSCVRQVEPVAMVPAFTAGDMSEMTQSSSRLNDDVQADAGSVPLSRVDPHGIQTAHSVGSPDEQSGPTLRPRQTECLTKQRSLSSISPGGSSEARSNSLVASTERDARVHGDQADPPYQSLRPLSFSGPQPPARTVAKACPHNSAVSLRPGNHADPVSQPPFRGAQKWSTSDILSMPATVRTAHGHAVLVELEAFPSGKSSHSESFRQGDRPPSPSAHSGE